MSIQFEYFARTTYLNIEYDSYSDYCTGALSDSNTMGESMTSRNALGTHSEDWQGWHRESLLIKRKVQSIAITDFISKDLARAIIYVPTERP